MEFEMEWKKRPRGWYQMLKKGSCPSVEQEEDLPKNEMGENALPFLIRP